MIFQALFTLLYGLALAGGGYAGFKKVGSVPSLVGGGVIGGLALFGSLLMFNGDPDGRGLALLGASLAILFFGWKLSQGLLRRRPIGRAAGILALSLAEVAVLTLAGSGA